MASLAKLAIKLVADMEQAQKDFTSMSSSITNIAKSAQNATPSMKNLTDSVKGLEIMQGAVQKAVEIEDISTITHAKTAFEELKSTVQRMGEGVSDDILKMNPTINNVQKAQREIEKLTALQKEMGKEGYLLDSAILKANENLTTFSEKAVQSNAELQMLKSTIMGMNAMPFYILSNIMTDVLKGAKELWGTFNEDYKGIPARFVQITAAVSALVVVIGLAQSKMALLAGSTSTFMALWKSSVIYQGLTGIITLLNTILGTQIAITAATVAWTAAATLGLSLIVAGVAAWLVQQNNVNKEIENGVDGVNKIGDAIDKAGEKWAKFTALTQEAIKQAIQMDRNMQFAKGFAEIRLAGDWMFDPDGEAVRKNEVRENLKNLLLKEIGLLDNDAQDAAELKKHMKLLNVALAERIINLDQFDAAEKKLKEQFDPATKAAIKLAEEQRKMAEAAEKLRIEGIMQLEKEMQAAADKFREVSKTSVVAFKELSVQLNNVKHMLNPQEFANAKNKLLNDLARGLGIQQFLQDELTEQQKLQKVFRDLELYAREANLTEAQLIAAKRRATDAILKQADAIDEHIDMMQKTKPEDFVPQFNKLQEATQKGGSSNTALERGTVAYYEATVRADKPLLDENRKQTRVLANVERTLKKIHNNKPTQFTVFG